MQVSRAGELHQKKFRRFIPKNLEGLFDPETKWSPLITDPQPGVEPGEVEEEEGRAVAVQCGVPGAVQRHPGHQLVTRADQVHPSLTGPSISLPLSERFLPTLIVFSENHFFLITKSPVTSHNKDRVAV